MASSTVRVDLARKSCSFLLESLLLALASPSLSLFLLHRSAVYTPVPARVVVDWASPFFFLFFTENCEREVSAVFCSSDFARAPPRTLRPSPALFLLFFFVHCRPCFVFFRFEEESLCPAFLFWGGCPVHALVFGLLGSRSIDLFFFFFSDV